MKLDHLAIAATHLEAGVAWVSQLFGADFQPGGTHQRFGTHNALLGMGDLYLEVIAVDPAQSCSGPRWFALDSFAGPPRVVNWLCRCNDLDTVLTDGPAALGEAVEMARGDLRWRISVPPDGGLPFGGAYPSLIEWQGQGHPCGRLQDSPVRLRALEVICPDPDALDLPDMDRRVHLLSGPETRLVATFETPNGLITL